MKVAWALSLIVLITALNFDTTALFDRRMGFSLVALSMTAISNRVTRK
jgi:hypothetical protein